jgi:hypothetical protein
VKIWPGLKIVTERFISANGGLIGVPIFLHNGTKFLVIKKIAW